MVEFGPGFAIGLAHENPPCFGVGPGRGRVRVLGRDECEVEHVGVEAEAPAMC